MTSGADHGEFECAGEVMVATCMGAPCYAVDYGDDDGETPFNLTCVCAASSGTGATFSSIAPDHDLGLCGRISATHDRQCAASAWGFDAIHPAHLTVTLSC